MNRLALIALLLGPVLGFGQESSPDPMTTLARARERLLDDVARLPRYTCVQTIKRQYFASPFNSEIANSCTDIITAHDKRRHELALDSWDRLRLEVAAAGRTAIYSWVGATRLGEATLKEIAGKGAFGSGDFGPFITAIFTVATLKFEKETVVNGRRLLEYSYDVPANVSKYQIMETNSKDWFRTAYTGTFLLDPADSDLVRLTVRTAELPPETGKCQAISEVDYGRVLIHGGLALIPQQTRLRVIGRTGEETFNVATYANCHEFGSKTVIRFDSADVSTSGAANKPALPTENPFPPGLHFDLRIVTPIDSDVAAAGDRLDAVLRSPIRDKKGNVLATAGTHLHGRLVKMEQHSPPATVLEFAVVMESIDMNGTAAPISMVLDPHNGSLAYHVNKIKYGQLIASDGHFSYYGMHLKVDHLDAKGVTTAPVPPKNEESNPPAAPAGADKKSPR